MPILFSAVACGENLLNKYASCDGNFMDMFCEVLLKIPPDINKMTYYHGHYLFHYIVENNTIFFCVTDKTCQRSRAFLFLNEIKRKFKTYKSNNFTSILAAEMHRYSDDYSNIIIKEGELEELNSIGVESSERILGEKMLVVKTEDSLEYSSICYMRKNPEKIIIAVQKKNTNVIVGAALIIIVITLFILGPVSFIIVTGVILFFLTRS